MIFFDFDGTVVNLWPRYHQVFLAASEISGISQRDYMKAKRVLVSDSEVARYFGETLPEGYFAKKRILLEAEDYLQLDTPLVSPAKLNAMFSKFECRFLTNRRRTAAFLAELENLGFGQLSDRAIILDPDRGISKKEFLARNFSQSPHIVIGDSESEWETASLENIRAILVRTGLRQPEDFHLTKQHMVMPSASAFIASYLNDHNAENLLQ